jgi:hypothetical protein
VWVGAGLGAGTVRRGAGGLGGGALVVRGAGRGAATVLWTVVRGAAVVGRAVGAIVVLVVVVGVVGVVVGAARVAAGVVAWAASASTTAWTGCGSFAPSTALPIPPITRNAARPVRILWRRGHDFFFGAFGCCRGGGVGPDGGVAVLMNPPCLLQMCSIHPGDCFGRIS